ncbi:hypothetical protein H2248_006173 [Termitomyces sp. 'cryptogamus']|nr:hypothetical protein H2248_006173 [Termitomyces sp. 'cryptogamus']
MNQYQFVDLVDAYPTHRRSPKDKCVPEELPALIKVLPGIAILSPNAEEALSLLSIPLPPTPSSIEQAADRLLSYGIGDSRKGWVIIRSGGLGAYVKTLDSRGQWIDAYWSINDSKRIVDVTGAGNSFLGGLAAGLMLTGDVVKGKQRYEPVYPP